MIQSWIYLEENPSYNIPGLVALDTETTRFREPEYAWNKKTRIAPFGGHELVLLSTAGLGVIQVIHKTYAEPFLRSILEQGHSLVFHRAAFDLPVLFRAYPGLVPFFVAAIEENRIHDTQILEVLLQIATGSRTVREKALKILPSLKELAQRRAGIDLSKDPGIRLGFDQFLDPAVKIPKLFIQYAMQDAMATYQVYRSQIKEAVVHLDAISQIKYPIFSFAKQKYGLLSEAIQVKGSFSFAWLEQYPVRVDKTVAESHRNKLESEMRVLEDALVYYGWAKITPKRQKFSLRHKYLRSILEKYANENNISVDKTETGLIILHYDFWSKYLPKISKELYSHPRQAQTIPEKLQIWLRYQRARKLLSTYVYVYSSSEYHYPEYMNIGARTGRTSCRRPNLQNVPKRRDGIRALFIPENGHIFLEGDWDWAELCALAQIYKELYGGSELGRAINNSIDPHKATALRVFGTEDRRQEAKAINFGLPGGLGTKSFRKYAASSWGIILTEEEAQKTYKKALEADPELNKYLNDEFNYKKLLELAAKNLGMNFELFKEILKGPGKTNSNYLGHVWDNFLAWQYNYKQFPLPEPPGFDRKFDVFLQMSRTLTGRLRGRCTFTAAHNFPFQGLVADAGKLALWELYKLHREAPIFKPVAFIHDSILIQCKPEHAEDAKYLLTEAMIGGFKQVCPDINITVEVAGPLDRWGKNTSPWGEEE